MGRSLMSTSVGDQAELRRRKQQQEDEEKKQVELAQRRREQGGGQGEEEMDETTREYVDYFREKYGENPRSDILGIDGMGLFCLIYIVVAGVVLSILYFSVYARTRTFFAGGGGSSS